MLYPTRVAIIVNVVLLVFLLIFVVNGYEIWSKLHINDNEAVSGQFADFSGAYSNTGELDQRKQFQNQNF